jgi:hypothetical protein
LKWEREDDVVEMKMEMGEEKKKRRRDGNREERAGLGATHRCELDPIAATQKEF